MHMIARTIRRAICIALAPLTAISPSAAVYAQNAAAQAVRQRVEAGIGGEQPDVGEQPPAPPGATPGRTGSAAQPIDGAIDTAFVSPAAAAVVVLRPAQLMTSEIAKMLPTEVATAAGMKYVGFDPADVDEVVAFAEMPAGAGPPAYGVVVKFNKPFRASVIPEQIRAHAQLSELNGKKYLQSQHPFLPSYYGPNSQTLVVAPDETLRQLVQSQGQDISGALVDRLKQTPAGSDLYAAIDVAALRPMIGMYAAFAKGQAPPNAQPFFDVPNQVSAVELTLNLSGTGPTSLVAHANDDAAAQAVMALINDASQKYQSNLRAQFAEQMASEDPVERAFAQYAERISGTWMAPFMPTAEGAKLTVFHSEGLDESQKKMLVAALGIGVAQGLPATLAAREAARRNQSMNNLKQIALAFHNYHDTKRAFPANAIYSEDGTPLLSWRVQLLPFIEGGQELYQQFKLDEPWDSEHNKALIARMPEVYKTGGVTLEPGKTNLLAVVGPDCAIDGTKEAKDMRSVTDGTSNTMLFVEADPSRAVEWTKPEDLTFNPEDPKSGLGNVRQGGWNAAFVDGHVEFIADQIDPQLLKAYITRAGGEPINRNAPMAPPAALAPVQIAE